MILRFGDTTQGLPSDKTMVSKQNSIKKKKFNNSHEKELLNYIFLQNFR